MIQLGLHFHQPLLDREERVPVAFDLPPTMRAPGLVEPRKHCLLKAVVAQVGAASFIGARQREAVVGGGVGLYTVYTPISRN